MYVGLILSQGDIAFRLIWPAKAYESETAVFMFE